MSSRIKCKGCGKQVYMGTNFCPYCGMSTSLLEEEYTFKNIHDLVAVSRKNLERYLEIMKNPEEIEERIHTDKPEIFEKQKTITRTILRRFPEIKTYSCENPEIEFKAFIISVPYEKSPNNLQHDCLLRRLAIEQQGLVNFSIGSAQVASGLYAFDVPVWAPKRFGHELLFNQKSQIEKCLPVSQKKFLYCAEPWWVSTRIFDLDGRWVNWRLFYETDGIESYAEEKEEVPLYFHLFSNLEYSDLFSTAGTSGDGEVLMGLYGVNESGEFSRELDRLGELYRFGKKPEIETVKISWNTLELLGLIGESAQHILKPEKAHFFRKTISQGIIEDVERKTALDTKKTMITGKSFSEDDFMAVLGQKFLWLADQSHQVSMMRISQGIPRELRKKYRIVGD